MWLSTTRVLQNPPGEFAMMSRTSFGREAVCRLVMLAKASPEEPARLHP